jgi:hypothetical protein
MMFRALSRRMGRTSSRWRGAMRPTAADNAVSTSRRCFHFASQDYAACFQTLPEPDTASLRTAALEYLDSFDPDKWHKEPVRMQTSSSERTKHVDD